MKNLGQMRLCILYAYYGYCQLRLASQNQKLIGTEIRLLIVIRELWKMDNKYKKKLM